MAEFLTNNYGAQGAGKSYSYAKSDSNLRFEVRSGDKWSGDSVGKERSEIALKDKFATGSTYEVSYKMMVEAGAKNTADWLLLGQVHQTEDAADLASSPPFAIQMVGEKMQIVVRSTNDAITKTLPPTQVLWTDSADLDRDHWYDIKIVVKFDPAGNGYLNVVRDGATLVTYSGPLGYNDAVGGYWKEGVYREASAEGFAVNFSNLDIHTVDPSVAMVGADAGRTLTGTAGVDHLVGGAGADTLNASGLDKLEGGGGDDLYVIGNAGVQVIEAIAGGTDTVRASVSLTLGNNVENLVLAGVTAISGTGNELANDITGNNANNSLKGLAGDDILHGAGGDDILDGGLGQDTLYGGLGNDTYYIDDLGDKVYEQAAEGNDLVYASVNFTLGANIEKLVLTGAADLSGTGNELANTITGNAGANVLNGMGGSDFLYGYDGNDILDGGQGTDTLYGGAGDDTYYVDADRVIENANEGHDQVFSSSTFVLGANIEDLTLVGASSINGSGNGLNNVLIGNDAANMLSGYAGDDTLKGGAGDDTLYGGAGADLLYGEGGNDIMLGGTGDDVYFVDNAGDRIVEGVSEGLDVVNSTVSLTLSNNVETLNLLTDAALNGTGNASDNIINGTEGANILDGAAGADTLTGLGGADTLIGGAGDDVLVAGDGDDHLIGGSGSDVMTGGSGADLFEFHTFNDFGVGAKLDQITDFNASEGDRIDLTGIDANTVTAGVQHFTFLGANPFTNHAGELHYVNLESGLALSGDRNGDGVADFQVLVSGAALSASDFIL